MLDCGAQLASLDPLLGPPTRSPTLLHNADVLLLLLNSVPKDVLDCGAQLASRIHCRCSDHPHDLLLYYIMLLLLLLLLYVLPRSRGTGPLVLGDSALLLDEPASAELHLNMLVIFREAEVAFLAASVLAFGPGLRAVALLVLHSGRPRLEPSSPLGFDTGTGSGVASTTANMPGYRNVTSAGMQPGVGSPWTIPNI